MTFSYQEAKELYLKSKAERDSAERYEATKYLYNLLQNALKLKLKYEGGCAHGNGRTIVQIEAIIESTSRNDAEMIAFNWLTDHFSEFEKLLPTWFPDWNEIKFSGGFTSGNKRNMKIVFVGEDFLEKK